MKASVQLPLGVDLGETRIRVARVVQMPSGSKHLVAVATRDFDSADAAARTLLPLALDELAREAGHRTRKCVIALPASKASVTIVQFPKMSWSERRRAASFESSRLAQWNTAEVPTVVRVRSMNRAEGRFGVGVARRDAIDDYVAILRSAKLRAARVDLEGYALKRAYPLADAVVDVAASRATIHAFGPRGVVSATVTFGGAGITRGIATELKIAHALAEKRKRVLGTAGAGEAALSQLVEHIAEGIERLRSAVPIRRVALTGNGSRLSGLDTHLEAATGCMVEFPVSSLMQGGDYPEDVVRAAAPDWTMAVSLARWSRA